MLTNRRLVTGTELLVDLRSASVGTRLGDQACQQRTYWFIRLVFPHPLSPSMITLRRTFFLDAIVAVRSLYCDRRIERVA